MICWGTKETGNMRQRPLWPRLRAIPGLLGLLLLGGCQSSGFAEFVKGVNELHISHCFYVQAAVAPYGNAFLYAKAGTDLNCEAIWKAKAASSLP